MTTPHDQSILVVDDHDIFRERLARALRSRGWHTHTAVGVEPAKLILDAHTIHRAVVDLNMPGGNGMELVRHISAHHPDVDVVILTGYGSISTTVEAIQAGAVNYLPKPADADDVLFAFEGRQGESKAAPTYQLAPSLGRAEWEHIQRVLSDCGGNITQTAKKLGIHRRTLQRKLDAGPSP